MGIKEIQPLNEINPEAYLGIRQRILETARKIALGYIVKENDKRKIDYDKLAKPFSFQTGDIVTLKAIRPPNIKANKLYPIFVGPNS